MISTIIFILLATAGTAFFLYNAKKVHRNIFLGKQVNLSGNTSQRINIMLRVAFGQSKMATRPIPFILHLFVYIGFVLINIEVLEMVFDGLFHTHRAFFILG